MKKTKNQVKQELWEWYKINFKDFDNPGTDKVIDKAIEIALRK